MAVVERFLDLTTPDEQHALLGRRGRIGMLVVGVLLVFFPPVAQAVESFWLNIAIRVLIFALFALSFDFAFGHAGLASFGHAAMFGTGGYAVAFLLKEYTKNLIVVLLVAMVVGMVVAALLAWLSARARDIYFAFLTLAFAQMFYVAADQDIPAALLGAESITNGSNGIVAITPFKFLGIDFFSQSNYYYLTLILVALSVVCVLRLANSPFGRVLLAIRENEDRVAYLGYNVRAYKIIGFALSGAFAGLAGALFVTFQSLVHPNMLFWTTSGEVFLMTLLGGMGTLWGPMLGAGVVVVIEDIVSANWKLVLGTVYILVVIFAPQGLASIFRTLAQGPRSVAESIRSGARMYVRKVFR